MRSAARTFWCRIRARGAWCVRAASHGAWWRRPRTWWSTCFRQWVVVFPKRLRYFLNVDVGCLNRVAGITMSEVQRATAGSSTSTAQAARSGGVLFVHRFGATLNARAFAFVHAGWCGGAGAAGAGVSWGAGKAVGAGAV